MATQMQNDRRVLVVGIGGVSNGGKTTLAEGLAKFLKEEGVKNVKIVHQDNYFKEENHVPFHASGEYRRWDELIAYNMDKMVIEVNQRIKCFKESLKSSVLIIEGILIFNHEDLDSLFSLRYLLTLNKEEARKRRLNRSYDPPDALNIFNDHVWPMYLKYLDELRDRKTDIIKIDGTDPKEQILAKVLTDTKQLLGGVPPS